MAASLASSHASRDINTIYCRFGIFLLPLCLSHSRSPSPSPEPQPQSQSQPQSQCQHLWLCSSFCTVSRLALVVCCFGFFRCLGSDFIARFLRFICALSYKNRLDSREIDKSSQRCCSAAICRSAARPIAPAVRAGRDPWQTLS